MAQADLALEMRGLGKRFGGKRPVQALKDVDLEVRRGEFFGLLGPNGAGKTTLITILTGLTLPDEGDLRVLGMDPRKELHRIQGEINLVRGFSGVLERLSCEQLLREYALLYGVPRGRVGEVLERTGLWERRRQNAAQFSSGWRQRFFLAKALLNRPKVLFLDEPTVGLDIPTAQDMRQLLRELHDQGTTLLLTTHHMRDVEELCGRIALIAGGRLVAQGCLGELREQVRWEDRVLIRGPLDEATRSGLAALPGVHAVIRGREWTRLRVADAGLLRAVAEHLVRTGVPFQSLSLEEPGLEEIFLRLTRDGAGAEDGTEGPGEEGEEEEGEAPPPFRPVLEASGEPPRGGPREALPHPERPPGALGASLRRMGACALHGLITLKETFRLFDATLWPLVGFFAFTLLVRVMSPEPRHLGLVVLGSLGWRVLGAFQMEGIQLYMDNYWHGMVEHFLLTPLRTWELIAGGCGSALVKSLGLTAMFLWLARAIYGFQAPGLDVLLGLGACALCGLVFAALGFALAFLGQGRAFAFIFAFPDVVAALSGVYYPLDALPGPLRLLASLLPTSHAFGLLKAPLGLERARPDLFLATLLPWWALSALLMSWTLRRARRKGLLVKMK